MNPLFAVRGTAVSAALAAALAMSAQTIPAPTPAADDTIVLSPFVVDASAQTGYLANQTLSGTRLKTDLKDIGSSITIFTDELMNDLGANNVNDLIAYAPNTDPFITTLNDTSGNGNDLLNTATQYVTRGGATSVVGQDFFVNNIPNDRFNSESLTFTRGPNAILFGLGNASGAFVSSTKRAKLGKTATTVEAQIDDRGSYRYMLDHNQVIIKNKLAFRYAGLNTDLNSFRFPAESYQRRHFGTMTLKPFEKTTIRVNRESGYIRQTAVRAWSSFDAVTPWLDSGSPFINTYSNTTGGKPVGTTNYTTAGLVSTEFSPAGTPIPIQSLRNQGQSQLATYTFKTAAAPNGYPAVGGDRRSLNNDAIYPTLATSYGGSFQDYDYNITSVFLEQEITPNFFIEGAINKVENQSLAGISPNGANDILYVDVNRQLPGGLPNPNAGMLYVESPVNQIVRDREALNKRLMASYDLDFTKQQSNWVRALGKHRIAAFYEESLTDNTALTLSIYNATPAGATPTTVVNTGANRITYRYYLDPAAGIAGLPSFELHTRYPIMYAGSPTPARDPSGITPAYMVNAGPTANRTELETYAVALQSNLWSDRLILTNGWRTDSQRSWSAIGDNYPRDVRNLAPDPSLIDVRELVPNSLKESSGDTYSRGVVFHALPWLSLAWNTSSNFQPITGGRNIYGDVLPNPQGKGSDYTLKFALLDRRVFLDVTYYTNSTENKVDNIMNTPVGNFRLFDRIWEAIADYEDLRLPGSGNQYTTAPYSSASINGGWSDSASTTSKGWEFSLTANPTKQWRMIINGSKRGNGTTTSRGLFVSQYMAEYIPIIQARADWQSIPTIGGQTVASDVVNLQQTLANFSAIRDLPADVFAPNWGLNVIQNYTFTSGSWLSGFSLGATMNLRGKTIAGFAESSNDVLNPAAPYYAPSTTLFGASITYRRKLFKNIDWRLQLNVRNVFDQGTISPLRILDSRDGAHTPSTAIHLLKEPRTYQITSTFKF